MDYHFVSREAFLELKAKDGFIEKCVSSVLSLPPRLPRLLGGAC